MHVTDTGIGIDHEELPNIFGMFQQVRNQGRQGGVGLGLYIVKRFVEQLEGQITVSSEPGEGSTFRVSLPALSAVETAQAEPQAQRPHLVA